MKEFIKVINVLSDPTRANPGKMLKKEPGASAMFIPRLGFPNPPSPDILISRKALVWGITGRTLNERFPRRRQQRLCNEPSGKYLQ